MTGTMLVHLPSTHISNSYDIRYWDMYMCHLFCGWGQTHSLQAYETGHVIIKAKPGAYAEPCIAYISTEIWLPVSWNQRLVCHLELIHVDCRLKYWSGGLRKRPKETVQWLYTSEGDWGLGQALLTWSKGLYRGRVVYRIAAVDSETVWAEAKRTDSNVWGSSGLNWLVSPLQVDLMAI